MKILKLKKTASALTIFEISFKYGYSLENCRGQNIHVILIMWLTWPQSAVFLLHHPSVALQTWLKPSIKKYMVVKEKKNTIHLENRAILEIWNFREKRPQLPPKRMLLLLFAIEEPPPCNPYESLQSVIEAISHSLLGASRFQNSVQRTPFFINK